MVKQMDERQAEKLSAIIDGESHYDDVISKAVNSNPILQEGWRNAHLIRDVIQGHAVSHDALSLGQRVSEALEGEPAILAPKKRYNPKAIMKQASGFAIAATIAIVAVLTVQQRALLTEDNVQTVASLPVTNSQPSASNLYPVANKDEMPRVSMAVERKLSSYIVNHNEYSATSNMQGMLPYVRIVGYVPTRQVANEK